MAGRLRLKPQVRQGIRTAAGIVAAIFAAFTLVAVISYFFTWWKDASLSTVDGLIGDRSVVASNSSAKLGYLWADFLVGRSLGFGALLLAAFFCVLAVWFFLPRRFSLGKWFLILFGGSFVVSWAVAYVDLLAGGKYLFGSGAGGAAGTYAISWLNGLIGPIITGLCVIVVAALWCLYVKNRIPAFSSKRDETEDDPDDEFFHTERVLTPSAAEPVEAPGEKPAAKPLIKKQKKREAKEEAVSEPVQADEGLTVVTDDETFSAEAAQPLPRIDNRLDYGNGGLPRYKFPPLDILGDHAEGRFEVSQEELSRNNQKIRATLASYKIQVQDVVAIVGPTVTLYKVFPAPGVKISSIKQLSDDIGVALKAKGVRIVVLEDSVGIEVANDIPSIVPLKTLLSSEAFTTSKAELPVAIGYTISQKVKVFDLADAPHLLVAGATKQGKSVGLNVIVSSLLYSKHPSELKFVFIDPKMVEFSAYSKLLYHYLAVLPGASDETQEKENAIIKKPKAAADVLQSLCIEMDRRYEMLSKAGVNNIKLYNEKFCDRHLLPSEGHSFLPYLVTVIDEYADLTMSVGAGPEAKAIARSITTSVIRLAQKGRAAGLHVILATQRPTVDVITGLIKANFPMRIAFRVTSRTDSATILDQNGAEKLIGRGDMLLYSGVDMERVQCAFVSNKEISLITDAVGDQDGYQAHYSTAFHLPEPPAEEGSSEGGMVDMKVLDERFEEAARLIVQNQKGSTSDLQRRLGMGYAKAGRVMDQLEAAGIVGPQVGSKPREVYVKDFAELDDIIRRFTSPKE